MKPLRLPMSLTTPTPAWVERASTAAARSALHASSTAVSKPNVLSTRRMSLSTLLGRDTTAHGAARRRSSTAAACAALFPPSPPTI